jgi:hypothetical protein
MAGVIDSLAELAPEAGGAIKGATGNAADVSAESGDIASSKTPGTSSGQNPEPQNDNDGQHASSNQQTTNAEANPDESAQHDQDSEPEDDPSDGFKFDDEDEDDENDTSGITNPEDYELGEDDEDDADNGADNGADILNQQAPGGLNHISQLPPMDQQDASLIPQPLNPHSSSGALSQPNESLEQPPIDEDDWENFVLGPHGTTN